MKNLLQPAYRTTIVLICALLSACASSTTATISPSPQAPVCDASISALILWTPQWRADQKDVPLREEAAAQGLNRFAKNSGCFANTRVLRVAQLSASELAAQKTSAAGQYSHIVTIRVRELGPVVKLLSSAALVEGGTEVVLDITVVPLQGAAQTREFAVHWRDGGPGVVKGVASLPADMQAALVMGLQPTKVGK